MQSAMAESCTRLGNVPSHSNFDPDSISDADAVTCTWPAALGVYPADLDQRHMG